MRCTQSFQLATPHRKRDKYREKRKGCACFGIGEDREPWLLRVCSKEAKEVRIHTNSYFLLGLPQRLWSKYMLSRTTLLIEGKIK